MERKLIKKDSLEGIFADYAFEKMGSNGFLPLPLPTGSGKTTAIFNFIYCAVKEKLTSDKIILITSLKKNLQICELKRVFEEHGDSNLFKEKVLFLKSYMDCVTENLPELIADNQIPQDISDLTVFINLYNAVKYCNKFEKTNNPEIQEILVLRKNQILTELEPSFRSFLKKTLRDEFKEKLGKGANYKIKLDYINKTAAKKWKWVLTLYPQILTNEAQVYVMSMDKFLLKNDPIIENSYFFYRNKCNNAIIFIDEFDATKDTILKRLIEDAVKNKIDYVAAFSQIRDRLIQGQFPKEMTTPSHWQAESENGIERLEKVIPGWNDRVNQITERFNMQYVFKNTLNLFEDEIFLFQNIHSLLVSKRGDKKRIVFLTNDDNVQNEIFLAGDLIENEKSLNYMLKDIRGFLKFFCGGVWILACNLKERKDELNIEYSIDNAVNSILDNFFPGDKNEFKRFFKDSILLYYTTKEENKKNAFDASFFENGFTFYSIEDENDHSLRSVINLTELESTPEKILLGLCKKNRVFGVSATANYDTLMGNFALKHYLLPKLNKKYFELDKSELKILENRFNDSICNYGNVKIKTESISTGERYDFDSWKKIISDDEGAEEIYNLIQQQLSNEESKDFYYERRYLRIAKIFKTFIETEDIKSFLCLLTAFPSNNNKMNSTVLEKIFNILGKEKYSYKDNVCILRSGNDYEANKDELKSRLSKGEKILVISTYATVGAGQNLQYKIPENLRTVKINNFPDSEEKDFDAIYLDKPTNLLVQLKPNDTPENLVRYIAQAEYLKESGEISYRQSKKYIEDAFKLVFYGQKGSKLSIENLPSYLVYATKVIVQAIGRICRTNMKSPVIHIYYDAEIKKFMNKAMLKKNLLNPEFAKLIEDIPEEPEVDLAVKNMEELASTKSEYALSKIIKYVEEGRLGWKIDAIEDWQNLRAQVLKYPTMTEEEFIECDERFKPFYIELNEVNDRVYFERTGDYEEISVHFRKTEKCETVSADSARLSLLLLIPCVKELFLKQDFALSFKKAKYIICPPVFTNIYKGALGEVAGRAILEEEGIFLEEIKNTDLFELFDYKVSGKDIYVDFKHWSEYSAFLPRNEDLQPHIFKKLQRCNGKKAVIINLLADNDYAIRNQKEENLELITIPKLYETKDKSVKRDEAKLQKIINFIKG